MASLSLEKEGRQRSLKEQQRHRYDEDSEDNQSNASENTGLEPEGARTLINGYSKRTKQLPWSCLLAYAAPMIGAGGMNFTLTTFAAYFYTDTMGLAPGVVGKVQMSLMMMYAVSEPIFGWLSDITGGWVKRTCGRRKPYLAISAFLHSVTFIGLMGPPGALTADNGLIEWAFAFAVLLGMSWGCNEVTFQALGAQMTFDYDERTKLQAIAVSVITLGSTSCGLLHGVLGSTLGATVEATRLRFLILGSVYAGVFFLGTCIMLIVIKEENVQPEYSNGTQTLGEWIWSGVESTQQMFLNLPFFLMMVSYSCMIMAGAVTPMMLPYFCKHVVQSHFATDWAPLLFTASAVVGMPIWVVLGSSYFLVEKKWRFVFAGAWVGCFLGLSALIVKPGDNLLFISFSVLGGLGMGGYFATPEAMKPDVVDYDEFRTGARHEARFAGVFMFFANICAGVALEVMLLLLDHFGYDGNKRLGDAEPEAVVTTIRVGFGSTLLMMLALIIPAMVCYPITRQKHADILTAIQRRLEGEHAPDPLYGGRPLPPYDNVPITRRVASLEGAEPGTSTFLQQVGMEVGSLAGIHGDRTGIRNVP
ncbi:uncharacterized protein LOC34621322 [Cyclospora cayetanensis]|uniref:Major facilitator family protein n=2 Tax=Cyclospora cayetanensis TaxID=88456 RepID=A0A1D3D0W5_9EIME|nr:uncharacterized protein LOC34621322 [Cyclospora cayetanensis]OEH77090.1 major facilitator family protein [Cyclospora cayetanensis]